MVQSLTPWPKSYQYRRASVNGFGYGGANAHVILDAAESFLNLATSALDANRNRRYDEEGKSEKHLLVFSAHDRATLNRNKDAILSTAQNYEIADLAYTLSAHRSNFQHRGFSIWDGASSRGDLQDIKFSASFSRNSSPTIAFVFTGTSPFLI